MTNTNSIQLFNYEEHAVRTVAINGEVWFVAKDVCDVLGLTNAREAVSELDDDEKGNVRITDGTSPSGGNPNMNVINEPGLYALVFKSRKPEAKAFARWVRHDVLPQVMHTGNYTAGTKRSPKSFYAAEHIIEKAFKCKTEADCQQVKAIDRMFQGIYGYSALEAAAIQPEANSKSEPRHNKREAELWEHIVSTFAPDEWFSISELMQSLEEMPVCIRQIRRYLLAFVANKQLKRRGNYKGTEYIIGGNHE
jgi:prophage antirepressor-like protein